MGMLYYKKDYLLSRYQQLAWNEDISLSGL